MMPSRKLCLVRDRGEKAGRPMSHGLNFQGKHIKQYHLLRPLGIGGFAAVYLAEDSIHKTLVAFKILFARLDAANILPFISESKMVLLDHPHIVRVRDFDVSDDGHPYFVMDYMAQGNLRQRHKGGESVPWHSAAAYVRQVAEALQYVHDKGLVHRDVKPENILIADDGSIQLSDFGVSVLSYTVNPSKQTPYGTHKYIAPEQIYGQAVRSSDQYALGVIMYEWLTGAAPFEGTANEIFAKHVQVVPIPLRKKNPAISVEVEAIVMKMLAKKPEQRFASMQDFLAALEHVSVPPSLPLPSSVFSRDHAAAVFAVVWSPDGRFLASAGQDMGIQVWEVVTGKSISSHDHGGEIRSVKWSPDGRSLVSAGADEIVHVWEAATGNELLSYAEHEGSIHDVAWSPDSMHVASAGDDNIVQVWDLKAASLLVTYNQHYGSVLVLAWSPDGKYIASAGADRTVRIWEAVTGDYRCIYHGHSDRVTALVWSPDGMQMASSGDDGIIQLWYAHTGKPIRSYRAHEQTVSSLAWSPDGRYLASSSWDKTVRIWDITRDAACLYSYNQHTQWVNAIVWSPDGRYLASASWDKTVRIFAANAFLPSSP